MDLNVHGLACARGRDHDFLDHSAQPLKNYVARLAFAHAFKMQAQFGDESAVAIGRGRVQNNRLVFRIEGVGLGTKFVTLGLQPAKPIEKCIGSAALDDKVDEVLYLVVEVGQTVSDGLALAGLGRGQFAPLGMVACDIGCDHFWIGKVVVESLKHAFFDMFACDRPVVVAVAALPIACAADAVIADHRIARAAASTFGQAREEMARLGGDRAGCLRSFGLSSLCQSEDGPFDDRQMRRFGALPFRFGIGPGNALARGWVFYETLTVPDDFADVETVLQDAVCACL